MVRETSRPLWTPIPEIAACAASVVCLPDRAPSIPKSPCPNKKSACREKTATQNPIAPDTRNPRLARDETARTWQLAANQLPQRPPRIGMLERAIPRAKSLFLTHCNDGQTPLGP